MLKHAFHVGQFLFVTLFCNQLRTAVPKFLGINSGVFKNGVVLHVMRTEGMIKVIHNGNDIMGMIHKKSFGSSEKGSIANH